MKYSQIYFAYLTYTHSTTRWYTLSTVSANFWRSPIEVFSSSDIGDDSVMLVMILIHKTLCEICYISKSTFGTL